MKDLEFYLDNPIIDFDVGILVVKDLEHRFIASNHKLTDYSGLHPEQLVGLRDLDMPWQDMAQIYTDHEKDILAGKQYQVIEPLQGLKSTNLLTRKVLLYDQHGKPAGTALNAMELNSDIEFAHLGGHSSNFKVCGYGAQYNLTPMESKVFYHFIKGRKRARVAELLGISTSSFDFHIRNIKHKFQVDSNQDLRYLAYQNKFEDIFPFQMSVRC
ncbi:helix-turn-helix transcriptional regulator [Dongshaea marina]|uniref:helix-turn-helix transcriptional regulator n=1 Tax=Dongshaea marina TaxID=2047966 RepID=UPI000D3E22CC|nr:helix-turn-helix transcriptional regulator [Dongshaea marina]